MAYSGKSRWLSLLFVAGTCLAVAPARAADQTAMARMIIDNDFSGDPDGLYQLAHHVLSPSVDLPLIVGSHLPADLPWDRSPHQAQDAADKAQALLAAMGRTGRYEVVAGAQVAITARSALPQSAATRRIIAEAMRTDRTEPLVYAAGAGLTDLALAWLAEPRIGTRIRLVWIGGEEHAGLGNPPPGPRETEFNFSIDPVAAQIVFNESDIEIWQVPRNVYRQLLVSQAELRAMAQSGASGRYLKQQLDRVAEQLAHLPGPLKLPRSETYVMGDSPLVTLTALQSPIQPDPSSSAYVTMPTPRIDAGGRYQPAGNGRPMRVYTAIDTRLTFADLAAKLSEEGAGEGKGKPR